MSCLVVFVWLARAVAESFRCPAGRSDGCARLVQFESAAMTCMSHGPLLPQWTTRCVCTGHGVTATVHFTSVRLSPVAAARTLLSKASAVCIRRSASARWAACTHATIRHVCICGQRVLPSWVFSLKCVVDVW